MFNYQSKWLSHLYATVTNSSAPRRLGEVVGLSGLSCRSIYPEWPPFRQGISFLEDFTREWRQTYSETYHRINLQAENWIRNTTLHYGAGVSIGVLASLILLLFLLSKVLPGKLKNLGYFLMFMGTSVTLWVLSFLSDIFNNAVFDTVVTYWQYVLGYCVVMGLLSFALVYRLGPVTNERTLNLIQWLLQIIGLILIYNSTQIREVSIALVVTTLSVYNFPRSLLLNRTSRKYWNRFFPPKVKLLTEDEYIQQGDIETKKALEQLREYCQSPECQSWKIISRLKSPQRFADFVEGNSWHITNEEMMEYDSDLDMIPQYEQQPAENNVDDDDESEMDFVLSSP